MSQNLSYVLLTPYAVAKGRTGGILARLLSQVDLELVGAQMIAMDRAMAGDYSNFLRQRTDAAAEMLASYVGEQFGRSSSEPNRALLLLFKGNNAAEQLRNVCGSLDLQPKTLGELRERSIQDTFGDVIFDKDGNLLFFEPAVITAQNQEDANQAFKLFEPWLAEQPNIFECLPHSAGEAVERTLVIVKPDNWRYNSVRPGAVIDMFTRTGLRLIGLKVHHISAAQALEFYGPVEGALQKKLAPIFGQKAKALLEEHMELTFNAETEQALIDHVGGEYAYDQFEQIIEFMSGTKPSALAKERYDEPGSSKSLVLIYEGVDAITQVRTVLGPTDPQKAPGGTIRRDFGSNVMVNTAHASDSVENAKREMDILKASENTCHQVIRSYLQEV